MTGAGPACPACGAAAPVDATFCEACGADLEGESASTAPADETTVQVPAIPVTGQVGEESPLDVGWTGVVVGAPDAQLTPPGAAGPQCVFCPEGHVIDGYCDVCGRPPLDVRDHFSEQPAPWVAGVCDIGIRHSRNEDGLATVAREGDPRHTAVVVCDGVSNTTDSHIASLAAARAARDTLTVTPARGVGTRESQVAAIRLMLGQAVAAADRAVEGAVPEGTDNPPSSTIVAAVVVGSLVVVGNVGDSRAYWLPDNLTSEARQLSTDDSWAGELIRAGAGRADAEAGPNAHAITRWLGVDSPEDLTPHCADVDLDERGWLLVCSDGLWNYCSDAADLRRLLAVSAAAQSASVSDMDPLALADSLVGFANAAGGQDNITVAVVRADATGSTSTPRAATAATPATAEGEDSTDG